MKKSAVKINTKQRMIESALVLFHKKGVHATSVDAVLAHSHTGKSQFSHYFKNKDGLIYEVLQYFYEQMKNGTYSTVASIQTWKDLDFWLRSFIKWQQNVECELSCPIGTIGHDLTKKHTKLQAVIKNIFLWRREFIARFFREEQNVGRMRKEKSPEVLADFCYTIIQGGLWMAKIERNTQPFENAMDIALTYLKSLRI